jgi:hypothetical protein
MKAQTWLAAAAATALAAAGCGSAATAPTPATARASLQVLSSEQSSGIRHLSSYTVDGATGRLAFVGTQSTEIVGPTPGYPYTALLTADPGGRAVYLATPSVIRSYAVNASSGALTLLGELPTEHRRTPYYRDGLRQLAAAGDYLYLLSGWYRFGSRTGYERMTMALDAERRPASRGVQDLELAVRATLADPERYHAAAADSKALLSSGRFYFRVRDSSVWSFAMSPEGQLSPVQVISQPGFVGLKLVLTEPRS